MPPALRGSLQGYWQANTRNRVLMTIGTGVIAILLLCGCLNLVGTAIGDSLTSLASSNSSVRPTVPAGTQVAQTNPTFPLPQPTVWNYPGNGATPVGSSGTPPPSPTASPTPSATVPTSTPTAGPTSTPGAGNSVTFQLSPNPGMFKAGTTNQIMLSGPSGTHVSVSVFFSGSTCLPAMAPNDPITLDAAGQGTISCAIPPGLKGGTVNLVLQYNAVYDPHTIPVV